MLPTLTKVIKYLSKQNTQNGRLFLISKIEQILQYLELIKVLKYFLPFFFTGKNDADEDDGIFSEYCFY